MIMNELAADNGTRKGNRTRSGLSEEAGRAEEEERRDRQNEGATQIWRCCKAILSFDIKHNSKSCWKKNEFQYSTHLSLDERYIILAIFLHFRKFRNEICITQPRAHIKIFHCRRTSHEIVKIARWEIQNRDTHNNNNNSSSSNNNHTLRKGIGNRSRKGTTGTRRGDRMRLLRLQRRRRHICAWSSPTWNSCPPLRTESRLSLRIWEISR